jgi:hypothetical protein
MTVFRYPVEVILEHNDNVVDTYEDEWGTYDIYRIDKVYWTEKAGRRWEVVVRHPTTGQPMNQTITPYEYGSKNIPTPARFNSYPLTIHCSLRRA